MHYTLRGKIAKAHPYQLDTTLTVYGAGAEAEATGKAIDAVKKTAEDHIKGNSNPHKVTKKQVGLEFADNTSDEDKPVSKAQAEAIAEAKKAGTDAQEAAENAQEAAEKAQTAADNAQTAADNARNDSQTAIENALKESKEYTDAKYKHFTVTLTAEGWTGEKAPYTQTVELEGILETDKPHWGLVYSKGAPTEQAEGETEGEEESDGADILELNLSEKEAYSYVDDLDTADGSVTFACFEYKPEVNLTIQMEVNR